jgi:hypothetical protein
MTASSLNKCFDDLDDGQLGQEVDNIFQKLSFFSCMIYASGSSAYETLREENISCLPSVSTLRKAIRRLNVNER